MTFKIAGVPVTRPAYVPKKGDIVDAEDGLWVVTMDWESIDFGEMGGCSVPLVGLSLERIEEMKQEMLDYFNGEEWVNREQYEHIINKVFASVDQKKEERI